VNEIAPARIESEAALTLGEARDRFEQAGVLRAPEREDGNQSRAARGVGVHRHTLIVRPVAGGGPQGEQTVGGKFGLRHAGEDQV
jgi:hypothetical protein